MNRRLAIKKIVSIFGQYNALRSKTISGLGSASDGKIYELFVLSELLVELRTRHYSIAYSHPGSSIAFKAAPGLLDQSEPHFNIVDRSDASKRYQVFVNVEFMTLGSCQGGPAQQTGDRSGFHELDIGVFVDGQSGRPPHDMVALGIECKAVAKLTKQMVRGVLGLRRELSVLTDTEPSILRPCLPLPARPASELRLVSTDQRVLNYAQSPSFFGIELKYMKP